MSAEVESTKADVDSLGWNAPLLLGLVGISTEEPACSTDSDEPVGVVDGQLGSFTDELVVGGEVAGVDEGGAV